MNLNTNHCPTTHTGDPPLWWGPWDNYLFPCVPRHPVYPAPNPWCPNYGDYQRGYQAGESAGKATGEITGRLAGQQTENCRIRQRLLLAGFSPEWIESLMGYGSPVFPFSPFNSLDKIIRQCQKAQLKK